MTIFSGFPLFELHQCIPRERAFPEAFQVLHTGDVHLQMLLQVALQSAGFGAEGTHKGVAVGTAQVQGLVLEQVGLEPERLAALFALVGPLPLRTAALWPLITRFCR